MKKWILSLLVFSNIVQAHDSAYFQRPLSCPLRFSGLSQLRDQAQALVGSLGNNCTQSNQQALNQLSASVANLEGIASAWNTYQLSTDQKAQNTQLAKNAGQVLGSLNLITSNNACFYDIRSRGTLPVLADIVMSLSQVGLLVPSVQGTVVATGGFLVGSGLKIINQLFKKKFNFNRPEEKRAFLQLNCAFFDNRRSMEEMGVFNPESITFRDELLADLKKERLELLRTKKANEEAVIQLQSDLDHLFASIPRARSMGISTSMKRHLDELAAQISSKPADHSSKLRQVLALSKSVPQILAELSSLKFNTDTDEIVHLLKTHLLKVLPELQEGGKAWFNSIDEFESQFRAPVMAFMPTISSSIGLELVELEAELSAENALKAKRISDTRTRLRERVSTVWILGQRLYSVESKIKSMESPKGDLFSDSDEGKSDAVELLDYYRKLQNSILGKEGSNYLEHTLKNSEMMSKGVARHLNLLDQAELGKPKCAAAEKLRFVWTQYRFKVQEGHDFVATNLDLYRSSFKIGRERTKRTTSYVLAQIKSVEEFLNGSRADRDTLGDFMINVRDNLEQVENRLRESGCF